MESTLQSYWLHLPVGSAALDPWNVFRPSLYQQATFSVRGLTVVCVCGNQSKTFPFSGNSVCTCTSGAPFGTNVGLQYFVCAWKQSCLLVLALLGWLPSCTIKFWLHRPESSSLLLCTLQLDGSSVLACVATAISEALVSKKKKDDDCHCAVLRF